jgi:prepilin-type N-terminal cleavage/methylation domain-containing protein
MKINKAFSLIEIAIVITVIAVISAVIINGLKIAASTKLKLSTHLTENSPILSMQNLDLWYETTLMTIKPLNKLMIATNDSADYGYGYQIYSRNRAGSILHPKNNQEFILTHTFDATANNGKFYINGELLMNYDSATSSEIRIDKFYLGKANYGSVPTDRNNVNGSYHGDYGEMIFFGDILSDDDRKEVEIYLSKKFDIKLNH